MKIKEKLAALWDDPEGVVLIFKLIWYGSYVAVMLFCLAVVGFLFGLEALAYFALGILIVGGLVVIYLLVGKDLVNGLIKMIGRPKN